MANAVAQRLRLRLFLEGIEIPVISAQVQAAPNGPMVCALQVPPLAEGTRLLPRTLVHLFFLDLYHNNLLVTSTGAAAGNARHPSAYEKSRSNRDQALEELSQGSSEKEAELLATIDNALADAGNEQYKLLFGGEVIGFNWSKYQAQRSLVLQCQDWSNYWDYAFQWDNTGLFGPGIKAMFSGGSSNLFTDVTGLTSKGSVITSLVSSGKCMTFPKLKGLTAGIIRLVEAIGGMYYPPPNAGKPTKKIGGQNIFFSLAELRLHITHMVATIEADPTSKRMLNRNGYSGMFNRALGGQGGQTSIRMAINALTKVIFFETYPQPCPRYISGLEGTVSGQVKGKLTDSPQGKILATIAANQVLALEEVTRLINTVEADTEELPPALRQAQKKSRQNLKKELQLRVTGARNTILKSLARMRNLPETARSSFSQAAQALALCLALIRRYTPGGNSKVSKQVLDKLSLAIEQLNRVQNLQVSLTPPKQREPARLNQQILRPDIWFGAPPRCNILFPEDYRQFEYGRMFLQEPTRFLLKTNDELLGENFLLDKFYFAPSTSTIKKDVQKTASIPGNDLLDHELFTGILPFFEKMGEFNIFAAASGTQRKGLDKAGLAQRSTSFIYFKHRFNSRQASVVGKFNPYVAVGFPGLILDKYVDRTTIQRHRELIEALNQSRSQDQQLSPPELSEILGTNFLGTFTQLSHMLSNQQQGDVTTQISVRFPRQPEETTEFLGVGEKVQTVRKRTDTDALRATDIAALSPPQIGSLGPNGGRIVNVTEVTGLYKRGASGDIEGIESDAAGKRLPIFQRSSIRRDRDQKKSILVPIGSRVKAGPDGSLKDIIGEEIVIFRAFRMEEEIPRYRREDVDLPMEELLRPSWYGDIWTNSKIGGAYHQLIGTGAITDEQQIKDPFGAILPSQSKESEEATAEQQAAQSADDPGNEAPAVIALGANASIQQAVEFIVLTYSHVRQQGLDLDAFTSAYRWRPIATMVDIFGTTDLEFTDTGESVITGIEGFHSRAFGPYDNVYGLLGPDLEDILGLKRGSTAAQRADTRRRKYEQVQKYISALKFSRAILG